MIQRLGPLPSGRVAVLIEPHFLPGYACERGFQQEVQQLASVDGIHGLAEAHVVRAEGAVHVVQPVGHSVDGVDDEAHLAVLHVIVLQAFITCKYIEK